MNTLITKEGYELARLSGSTPQIGSVISFQGSRYRVSSIEISTDRDCTVLFQVKPYIYYQSKILVVVEYLGGEQGRGDETQAIQVGYLVYRIMQILSLDEEGIHKKIAELSEMGY